MAEAIVRFFFEDYTEMLKEIDELDKIKATYTLFFKLQSAEERAQKEGWIDAKKMSCG